MAAALPTQQPQVCASPVLSGMASCEHLQANVLAWVSLSCTDVNTSIVHHITGDSIEIPSPLPEVTATGISVAGFTCCWCSLRVVRRNTCAHKNILLHYDISLCHNGSINVHKVNRVEQYKNITVYYSVRSRTLQVSLHGAKSRFSFSFLNRRLMEFCRYLHAFLALFGNRQCFTLNKQSCDCSGSVNSFIGKHNNPTVPWIPFSCCFIITLLSYFCHFCSISQTHTNF